MQVSVSPKFQVVIPKAVRESLDIKAGQKMEVVNYNGVIQLVPVPELAASRGLLSGIDNSFTREADRPL